MKKTTVRTITILLVMILCIGIVPVTALAAEGIPTCTVNVYVNGTYERSYALDESYCDIELRYGQIDLADLGYGDPTKAAVTVDGTRPDYTFAFGSTVNFFSLSDPELVRDGSHVEANVYYTVAVEELPEPEITYGTVQLNISDGRNPVAGYDVTITGKKAGYDTQYVTITSGSDGIARSGELDDSYEWSYTVDDLLYLVVFYDGLHISDHVVKVPEPEKPVSSVNGTVSIYVDGSLWYEKDLLEDNTEESLKNGVVRSGYSLSGLATAESVTVTVNGEAREASFLEGKTAASFDAAELSGEMNVRFDFAYTPEEKAKTYTVTVNYEFNPAPGGVLVDGFTDSEDAIVVGGTPRELAPGTILTLDETLWIADGLTPGEQDSTVRYNGNLYRLGAMYTAGGSSAANGLGGSVTNNAKGFHSDFTMIHSNVTINFIFTKIQETPAGEETPAQEPAAPAAEEIPAQEPAAPAVEETPVQEPAAPAVEETPAQEPAAPVVEETPAQEPAAPTVEEAPAQEPAAPAVEETPVRETAGLTVETVPDVETISEDLVPLGNFTTGTTEKETEVMDDAATPLTAAESIGAWALVNLLCAIVTAIAGLVSVAGMLRRQKQQTQDGEEESRRRKSKLLTLIPAVIAVILFVITENVHNPMALTDKWTVVMVLILAVGLALALITRNRKNRKDENACA
ncbi:MAG: hypothetical protein IJ052_05450 [Oscillospiraceae bacterium]|nr:hypothetical protein [Oscillospiraceae bacterium]